jgi:hypothetical protein
MGAGWGWRDSLEMIVIVLSLRRKYQTDTKILTRIIPTPIGTDHKSLPVREIIILRISLTEEFSGYSGPSKLDWRV